ncbi:MAG: IS66 family insertion sequence element accessory protein TnpB [Albidovulum sp.]|nr:IS66 family insertion sequence element accessory protein TnpB [Albidovulum sp.]
MPANVPDGGIWLSTRPADMRKSFDGLAALARNVLGADIVSGGWFVFADCRRTMMKINGFGPGGYLEDVPQRVAVYPSSRVEEPVPRLWKDLSAGDPMKSDLGTGVECRASDPPGAG